MLSVDSNDARVWQSSLAHSQFRDSGESNCDAHEVEGQWGCEWNKTQRFFCLCSALPGCAPCVESYFVLEVLNKTNKEIR